MRRMADRDALAEAFEREETDALVAAARETPGRVVRFLTGRLYSADEGEKWRAVRALGTLARAPDVLTDARVHDLLQRFLWALGRIGPDVVAHCPDALDIVSAAARSHPDAETRATAAAALASLSALPNVATPRS